MDEKDIQMTQPSQNPSGEAMEKAIGVVAYGVRFSKQDSSPDGMELEERIAFALDTQRAEVIEECARVAEGEIFAESFDITQEMHNILCKEIAQAIRSLGNREEGK